MAELILHEWSGIYKAHYRDVTRPEEYEYIVPSGVSKITVKAEFTLDTTAVLKESPVVIINGYDSAGDWRGEKEYYLGLSSPATMVVRVSAGDRISIAMPPHEKGPFEASNNALTFYSFSQELKAPDFVHVSVDGIDHVVDQSYCEVDGISREIQEIWTGIGGVKKLVYTK